MFGFFCVFLLVMLIIGFGFHVKRFVKGYFVPASTV